MNEPIVTKEQIQKMVEWLKSPKGKKAISSVKTETPHERTLRRSKEIQWWHKIKDEPFTI